MIELGLGCVQLGVPYGNAAQRALMPEIEAHQILRSAAARGIHFFDTAAAYGDSERRIGTSGILNDYPGLELATKIPQTTKEVWESESAFDHFLNTIIQSSLAHLNVTSLGLLQFHQCDKEFIENKAVQSCMRRLLEQRRCRQIGVSVYTPEEAELCCELDHVSALQVPVNLLDQRFFTPRLREKYLSRRMFIIGRSLLLQGVLVEGAQLPDVAKKDHLRELRDLLSQHLNGGSIFRAAITFAKWGLSGVLDVALIGADSLKSLEMNVDAWQISAKSEYEDLANLDLSEAIEFATGHGLLNPSTWNRTANA